MKSTCVFIYGAPAVGKTSIVNKLQMHSSEYVSVVETDFTRDFLRGFENFPHEQNFYESFFDLPPEEYRKQAESMSKNSANTAISRTQNGLKDVVFLGAHLIPSVIHQNNFDNINLKEILMVVSDENEHFKRLSTRDRNAHDTSNAFELTRNWQNFLIDEA
jgi:2-phosphoglycerate kinase